MNEVTRWGFNLPELPQALEDRIGAICRDETGYAVTGALGCLVARAALQPTVNSILEVGAGRSSLVFATVLAHKGKGLLTSVDHAPAYCQDAWEEIAGIEVDAALLTAQLSRRLKFEGLLYTYDPAVEEALGARGPYDLLFVDAPPGEFGRDCALHLAAPHLRTGATVILDDAARLGEWTTIRRWLRQYPGLEVLAWQPSFERGLAVFRYAAPGKRFSPRSFGGSVVDELQRFRDVQRFRESKLARISVAP